MNLASREPSLYNSMKAASSNLASSLERSNIIIPLRAESNTVVGSGSQKEEHTKKQDATLREEWSSPAGIFALSKSRSLRSPQKISKSLLSITLGSSHTVYEATLNSMEPKKIDKQVRFLIGTEDLSYGFTNLELTSGDEMKIPPLPPQYPGERKLLQHEVELMRLFYKKLNPEEIFTDDEAIESWWTEQQDDMGTYADWIDFLRARQSIEESKLRKQSRAEHAEKMKTYIAAH